MSDMISHKNFLGSVHYSNEDKIFHGKVEFIRDLVTYEGTDVNSLEKSFCNAVDDYLNLCTEQGREPDQPFKGSFNVRPGTNLHRRAAIYAREHGIKLNSVIVEALKKFLPV